MAEVRLASDLQAQLARIRQLDEHDRAVAERIAQAAAIAAPKDTGAGAASIHAEPDPDEPGAYRVSWDQEHFYMAYQELGTEHQPARPFLRPATQAAGGTPI